LVRGPSLEDFAGTTARPAGGALGSTLGTSAGTTGRFRSDRSSSSSRFCLVARLGCSVAGFEMLSTAPFEVCDSEGSLRRPLEARVGPVWQPLFRAD